MKSRDYKFKILYCNDASRKYNWINDDSMDVSIEKLGFYFHWAHSLKHPVFTLLIIDQLFSPSVKNEKCPQK